MPNAQQCPKCKRFILGDYCFTCQQDITTMINVDFFEEIFGESDE